MLINLQFSSVNYVQWRDVFVVHVHRSHWDLFLLVDKYGIHFVTVTKWQTRSKTKPHEIRTFVQRAKPLVSVWPPRLAAVQVDFNSPTAEFMPCCCSSCSEYWSSSRRRSLHGSGIVTHTAALALLNARAVRAAKQLYCSVVRQLAFR